MRYYLDCEFIEDFHKPRFGKRRHFIDLISIGIVAEDGREYYAISKDFDLKAVWNAYDMRDFPNIHDDKKLFQKVYWLRENVLKPIFEELLYSGHKKANLEIPKIELNDNRFTFKNFKKLINGFGKSNKQIATEIRNFVMMEKYNSGGQIILGNFFPNDTPNPEFYGYYADYDWVLFCSLFGRMIDLPAGFPMYCVDIKQLLDYKVKTSSFEQSNPITIGASLENRLNYIKLSTEYPKQENEHNALDDAKWNKQLFEFINTL